MGGIERDKPFDLIDSIGSFRLLMLESPCSVCSKLIILWHLLTSHEIVIRWDDEMPKSLLDTYITKQQSCYHQWHRIHCVGKRKLCVCIVYMFHMDVCVCVIHKNELLID